MKKRILAWVLALVMIVGLLPTITLAADLSGSGTKDDPYLIATADDLVTFRDLVNSVGAGKTSTLYAKLTDNIDLSGQTNWTPIGLSSSKAFAGEFDGNGHTISGLTIKDATTQYQGLFGYVKNGTIKNLTVDGSVETSNNQAAGIVGYGYPVTIENCTNEVAVTSTAKGNIGGVVGVASGASKIIKCSNEGNISGAAQLVGGIAGSASGATIQNCENSGTITCGADKPTQNAFGVGGIVGAGGTSNSKSTIIRCSNTGKINSNIKSTGGIAGRLAGTMTACYNTAAVTGIYETGGIVGGIGAKDTTITDCYNLGSVTCNTTDPTFKDSSSAKAVGGIVGNSTGSSSKATLTNCYNARTEMCIRDRNDRGRFDLYACLQSQLHRGKHACGQHDRLRQADARGLDGSDHLRA